MLILYNVTEIQINGDIVMPIKNINSLNATQPQFSCYDTKPRNQSAKAPLSSSMMAIHAKKESSSCFQSIKDFFKRLVRCFIPKKENTKETIAQKLSQIATENEKFAKDGKFFIGETKYKVPQAQNNTYDYSMFNLRGTARIKAEIYATDIQFTKEDALEAYLVADNDIRKAAILNMADTVAPAGGTYLQGAKGSEQNLCLRIPNLYPALCFDVVGKDGQYKATHKALLESNAAMITKGLTVVRNKDLTILEQPIYNVNVITAAAIDRTKESCKNLSNKELNAARDKAKAVLYAAAQEGLETLVLGAWGCEQNNDAEQMALVFKDLLEVEFKGVFKKVVFAIKSDENFDVFKQTISSSEILFPKN